MASSSLRPTRRTSTSSRPVGVSKYHFLRSFCQQTGREIVGFTDTARAAMLRYDWPGNVRELENAIERAVVLCRRPQIDIEDLPETLHSPSQRMTSNAPQSALDFADVAMPLEKALEIPERMIIERALKRNNWNRQATAKELDNNRTTLYKKMLKFGLDVGESNYAVTDTVR